MDNNELPDKNKFSVGFSDQSMEVMLVFIPLKFYADNEDGTALLRGKLDEAKSIALLNIQEMRKRKLAAGLIKPTNGQVPLAVQ